MTLPPPSPPSRYDLHRMFKDTPNTASRTPTASPRLHAPSDALIPIPITSIYFAFHQAIRQTSIQSPMISNPPSSSRATPHNPHPHLPYIVYPHLASTPKLITSAKFLYLFSHPTPTFSCITPAHCMLQEQQKNSRAALFMPTAGKRTCDQPTLAPLHSCSRGCRNVDVTSLEYAMSNTGVRIRTLHVLDI